MSSNLFVVQTVIDSFPPDSYILPYGPIFKVGDPAYYWPAQLTGFIDRDYNQKTTLRDYFAFTYCSNCQGENSEPAISYYGTKIYNDYDVNTKPQSITISAGSAIVLLKKYSKSIVTEKFVYDKNESSSHSTELTKFIINLSKNNNFHFDNEYIAGKVSAFIPSIELSDIIVKSIDILNEEYISGIITIEQFNEKVDINLKKITNNYGTMYSDSYGESLSCAQKNNI